MEISAFELEDVGRLVLKDVNGNPTGAVITLAGPGHVVTREFNRRRERQGLVEFNRRGRASLPSDPDELYERETERLLARTLGWEGFTQNGEPLPFAKEKAREFYENPRGVIREQVQVALASTELFTQGSSKS